MRGRGRCRDGGAENDCGGQRNCCPAQHFRISGLGCRGLSPPGWRRRPRHAFQQMGMGTDDAKRQGKETEVVSIGQDRGRDQPRRSRPRPRDGQLDHCRCDSMPKRSRYLSAPGRRDEANVCPHTDRAAARVAPPGDWRFRLLPPTTIPCFAHP